MLRARNCSMKFNEGFGCNLDKDQILVDQKRRRCLMKKSITVTWEIEQQS